MAKKKTEDKDIKKGEKAKQEILPKKRPEKDTPEVKSFKKAIDEQYEKKGKLTRKELDLYRKRTGEYHFSDINYIDSGDTGTPFANSRETVYNKGGSIGQQMELFQEGGLEQEGGEVDPVSGNEVPVGSTKEEVRDDIPARLSEGEFVMPADVVRFHGLDKMMQLRDEAKAGLRKMEAMGQMGNSDEATLPDDVPFGMDDLNVEDETQEMAEGGLVKAANGTYINPTTGISGFQPSLFTNKTTGFTPYTVPTQLPATSYIAPQQQNVPMANQGQLPTFGQVIPASQGKYDEIVEYENEEGLKLSIPFVNGQPIYPVPTGYKKVDKGIVEAKDVAPKPVNVPNVRQQDDGGDDGDPPPQETVNLGNSIYNVSHTSSNPVGIPGIVGGIANMISGRNDQVVLTNPKTKDKARLSKDTLKELQGKSANEVNSFLKNVFNAQKAVDFDRDRIAKSFPIKSTFADLGEAAGLGTGYGTPIKQQQEAAEQIAKDMGIKYNNQSLAEMIALSIEDADEKEAKMQSFLDVNKSIPSEPKVPDLTAIAKKYGRYETGIDRLKKYGSGRFIPASYRGAGTAKVQEKNAQLRRDKRIPDRIKGISTTMPSSEEVESKLRRDRAESIVRNTFSPDAQEDINRNEGTRGIGKNSNGTTYSINNNGTFTHSDGTTVNFTDSKGNPGNAPSQDYVESDFISGYSITDDSVWSDEPYDTSTTGYGTSNDMYTAKGGFIKKPKPKAKKMKQGGLASR
tara:strand:- start:2360 stop:4579 length:2220 start_codon:yes stop_codon:yes gene_type:complete